MSESSMRAVQVVKAGGVLSDRPFRLRASTFYPAARCHGVCGFAHDTEHTCIFLFLTFIAHFGAILFHTLIVRDGILKRMAP
jgi:cytochrome b561